ncbi:MAG: hypothetical protein ACI8TF_003142 [Paracoccaceae bacterium]
MRTSVPIAPNGGKDPEVIDAAACTFLHEGRIADLRCNRELNGELEESGRSGVTTQLFTMCIRSEGQQRAQTVSFWSRREWPLS